MNNNQKQVNPEKRGVLTVAVQASEVVHLLSLEHQAAQSPKLLTGELLRRLFKESTIPSSDMHTEAEVASWWKHYAGRVRNALNDGIAATPNSGRSHRSGPRPGRAPVSK